MAEADGIGAATAATGHDDQVGGIVETLRSRSRDALAVADDERSELYATAPLEEAEASSSKYIDLTAPRPRQPEQLPSSPKCSADDEYVTARRRRLAQLRSQCASESEFEMAKSLEHWTEVGKPSSEMDLVYVANRQHFQRLLDQDQKSEQERYKGDSGPEPLRRHLEVNWILREEIRNIHKWILQRGRMEQVQGIPELDRLLMEQHQRLMKQHGWITELELERGELTVDEERPEIPELTHDEVGLEGPERGELTFLRFWQEYPHSLRSRMFLSSRSRTNWRMLQAYEHELAPSRFFVEYDDGELVGEKITEGGQAEIFKATFRGDDGYVLKVFKSNISLADLERIWTIRTRNGFYHMQGPYDNCCFMESGTLLKDGSFAFLMERYWGDLRKLIDQNMMANNELGPPFSHSEALKIMLSIAIGMAHLHHLNILHRDLKASNVLIKRVAGYSYDMYDVGDFESSGAVRGTGFWRAPEVLQVVKNKVRVPSVWENIWSKARDVYSYAMTSYEVLTGCIPLGHLAPTDYDVVLLRGERPLLPDYIDPRIRELLRQCWHSDPLQRPTFLQILEKLQKWSF